MLRPIAQTGHDPVYSMGDDAPIAPLAGRARPLASYFRQRFAQVTNPAIDHYRERTVMSVATLVGARAPLDAEGPLPPLVVLPSFLVTPDGLAALAAGRDRRDVHRGGGPRRRGRARRRPCVELAEAGSTARLPHGRRGGRRSRARSRRCSPSPPPTAGSSSAACGRRARSSCRADEARDTHMVATLVGYGADVVCPRLALETVARLADTDKVGGDRPTPAEAQARLLARARGRRPQGDVEDGHLGRRELPRRAPLRGGRPRPAALPAVLRRHAVGDRRDRRSTGSSATRSRRLAASEAEKPELENPGFYKFRKGGEPHATDPDVVEALQASVTAAHALVKAVKGERHELYERFAALVNGRTPIEPRDLLELVPAGEPVPLDEVEPVESIVRRFSGGAMSHGALSAEAHETIAIALNRLGGRSNSRRGRRGPGPLPRRAQLEDQADRVGPLRRHGRVRGVRRGAPDQGRPGVEARRGRPDPGAQGDRGDRAPARARTPGVSLISPPPHHDIYSIEDLAQLVFDLREVNPDADISVKLVSSSRRRRDRGRRREGARGRRPRRRRRRRHGREPAALDQARGRAVGARARRDAAGARRERAPRPRSRPRRRRLQDRARRRRRRAARRRRVLVRHRAPARRGLPDGALVPPRHVPGGHREPAARAAREVRGHAGDGRGVPPLRRARGARASSPASACGRSTRPSAGSTCSASGATGDPSADALDLGRAARQRPGRATRATSGEPVPHEGDRLGALLLAQGKAAISGARLVEAGVPDHERRPRDRRAPRRRDREGGRLGRTRRAASAPASRARPGRASARSSPPASSSGSSARRTTTSARRCPAGGSSSRRRADDAGDPCLLGNTVLYGATGGELFCAGLGRRALRRAQLGRRRGRRGRRRPRLRVHDPRHRRRPRAARPQPRRRDDGRRGVPARSRTSGS